MNKKIKRQKELSLEEKWIRSLTPRHQIMLGEIIESVRSAAILSMSDDINTRPQIGDDKPHIDTNYWQKQSDKWLKKAIKLQGGKRAKALRRS